MPSEFLMLSANFPDLQFYEELKDSEVTPAKSFALMESTIEVIRKKLYDYAPIDKIGIAKVAVPEAAKIASITSFISSLKTIKPGGLEAQLLPLCKDDRDPKKIIEKKLAPVTDIAVGYYFSVLFEKLFPLKAKSQGKPPKKEFRFAANTKSWMAVRKVNLGEAERKEVLACMVHTLGTIDNKIAAFSANPAFFTKLDGLLAKYPPRKSFGKLVNLLEEAQLQGLFPENDQFLKKYALYKCLAQLGYSPYLSGEMLENIYPELKIPKPRGRLKKV